MKKIIQLTEKETLYSKYCDYLCFFYFFLNSNPYLFDLIYFLIGFIVLVLPSFLILNGIKMKLINFSFLLSPYKFIIITLVIILLLFLVLKVYLFYNDYSIIHCSERFALGNCLNCLINLDLILHILNNIDIKPEYVLNDYFSFVKFPLLFLSFYTILKNCLLSIKNSTEFTLIYLTIIISYFRDETPKKLILELILFFYLCSNCSLIYKTLIKQKYIALMLHSFLMINCIGTFYIIESTIFFEKELIINLFIFLLLNSYSFGKYFFQLIFKPIKEIFFLYPHINKPHYTKLVNYQGYIPPFQYSNVNNVDESCLTEERMALLSKENEKEVNYINEI